MTVEAPNGTTPDTQTLYQVVSIVSAYVSNNSLRPADLPDLIASIHSSIRTLSGAPRVVEAKVADNPAVPVKKSITKEFVVCLDCGKKFKSLRRHLNSFHRLSPDDYRTKWGLAGDYPMVAPAYSETRSQLAKESGLGQVSRTTGGPDSVAAAPASAPKKAKRGRAKNASA